MVVFVGLLACWFVGPVGFRQINQPDKPTNRYIARMAQNRCSYLCDHPTIRRLPGESLPEYA